LINFQMHLDKKQI